MAVFLAVWFGLWGAAFTLGLKKKRINEGISSYLSLAVPAAHTPTSPDVPGLLLVVSSPVPSSFRARRNSLLRSGPRRISFSLDGAISMGGVVLEGCCEDEQDGIV